jgi:tetratricopeptide (TPR) repeat protein
MLGWLLNLPRAIARRPAVALAATLVVVVIGLAGVLIGRQLWALHHLQAAQRDIDHWKFADAYGHLRRCVEVWPNDASTCFLAARTARRADLFVDAARHLDRYKALRGLTDDYNLELAMLKVQQGDMGEAEHYLRSHIDPDHPDAALALEAMAKGLLRTGRLATLVECTDLWLSVRPEETHALYYRGMAFDLAGNYKEAAEAYRRSVLTDPANTEAQLRLANLLLEHFSQPAEALEHFTRAMEEEPENPAARLGMARSRGQLGDRDEARRLLDDLLTDHPKLALALTERGKIALLDDQPERAEALLRQAVELAPDDKEALYTLISCLEERNKEEEANVYREKLKTVERDLQRLDELVRQLATTPGNADLSAELAGIYFRYRHDEEGKRWLAHALDLNPNHDEANKLLSIYRRKSKYEPRAPGR